MTASRPTPNTVDSSAGGTVDRRRFLAAVGAAAAGATALGAAPAHAQGHLPFPVRFNSAFAHGVASGDPLTDRVIVWTRLHNRGSQPVRWQLARDPEMREVVRSGSQTAIADHDYTIKVDVTGLAPATTYYYQFATGAEHSIIGRTRTAPADDVDEVRLAVLSCTSYWSSYWSGLGHLAARDDLDLVVHLGDYIYDFVDKDEQIRSRDNFANLREPDNRDWTSVAELRRRYALWRSDPHLNHAHQQHPWATIWDNHDLDPEFGNELTIPGMSTARSTTSIQDTARIFYEWTPTRPVRADGSGEFVFVDDGSYPAPPPGVLIYRGLRYGNLVDIALTDAQSRLPKYGLPVDNSHLGGAPSLLGRKQYEWLTARLRRADADGVRWRVIGTQTLFTPEDLPDLSHLGDIPKIRISRWSEYPTERDHLTTVLRTGATHGGRIRRNVFFSGDTHCNVQADVMGAVRLTSYHSGPVGLNPRTSAQRPAIAGGAVRTLTGNGPHDNARRDSVAVEFAPSSMGRGGFDDGFVPASVAKPTSVEVRTLGLAAYQAILTACPNLQFFDYSEHGYGIAHFTAESAIFEHWWQDKSQRAAPDVLGYQGIAWADDAPDRVPARYTDQINSVTRFQRPVRPTTGSRRATPAPLPD